MQFTITWEGEQPEATRLQHSSEEDAADGYWQIASSDQWMG
jgi:hypothetical protein